MNYYWCLTALILLSSYFQYPLEADSGKIVYLISMPRSGSTAFMRMMQASEEFYILHEPAIYTYVQNVGFEEQKITTGWFTDRVFKTHEDVKKHILEKAADGHVFVKEICFFVHDFLLQDEEFVSNPSVYFVFLARNPHNSIISYYNKLKYVPMEFSKFVGCRSTYEIYDKIKQNAKNPIQIILSESLGNHPKETAQQLFATLGIPFDEKCLHWENLGDDFTGAHEWNEVKVPELLYHWHDEAIKSTSFHPLIQNALDHEGKPTFEEIREDNDRMKCMEIYWENIEYYRKLVENA